MAHLAHLWIVESKNKKGKWVPVLRFNDLPRSGVYETRSDARISAKAMQNWHYYHPMRDYRFYRVRKYIRIEEGLLSVINDGWLPPHLRTRR